MRGKGYVYILTNKNRTTLYIGVTHDLRARIKAHKLTDEDTFVRRYKLDFLVYYEVCPMYVDAIRREKQLKKWKRDWKIELIKKVNPTFRDLKRELMFVGEDM
jgi:putative endonuclease